MHANRLSGKSEFNVSTFDFIQYILKLFEQTSKTFKNRQSYFDGSSNASNTKECGFKYDILAPHGGWPVLRILPFKRLPVSLLKIKYFR